MVLALAVLLQAAAVAAADALRLTLSPGTVSVGTGRQLLEALQAGVGDVQLTGGCRATLEQHMLAHCLRSLRCLPPLTPAAPINPCSARATDP